MRTELIGRERELAALTNHLDSALDKRPRVVCCTGEPGVGKTRLVEEFAGLVGTRGASAVWGTAADSAGAPPYWSWRQVLCAVATSVDVVAIAEEHRLTTDLGRLAPDVFGRDSPVDGGASTEDRFRQFDSIGRLLREVTLRRPLVIVLDDAHWADDGSLLLLRHVVRTLTDERLLLVVNHRDTEPLHPVLVTELPREPATRSLDLRGLPAAAVGRQLEALVGHDVAEERVAQVHVLTGGNPFFVGEMGRVLAERGVSDFAANMTANVTPNVRAAIGARLDRLSPECALVLQAASIVGREFSVAVLTPMVGPARPDRCHLVGELHVPR